MIKTKAPNPITRLKKSTPSAIIRFYFEFAHLKGLYRQGWLARGMAPEQCESVAEHSFGVALTALVLAERIFPELDLLKVLRMALIHDMGEIYAGDIIPGDQISDEEKNQLERDSVIRTFGLLTNGTDYIDLWEEYERGISPEAKFVRQIDKLEMALQASVYEHQESKDLDEFFQSARIEISSQPLIAILKELQHLMNN
jgi:putative hydrolase of HD superfamily